MTDGEASFAGNSHSSNGLFTPRRLMTAGASLFAVILVLSLILVYQNARRIQQQVTEQLNHRQQMIAFQAAGQIEDFLNDIAGEMLTIRETLVGGVVPSVRSRIFKSVLERTRTKGVVEVGMVDAGGAVIETHTAAGFRPGLGAGFAWMRRNDDSAGLQLSRLIITRYASGAARMNGLICLPIDENSVAGDQAYIRIDLNAMAGQLLADLDPNGELAMWLIDSDGRFLYHPRSDFIAQDVIAAYKSLLPKYDLKDLSQIITRDIRDGAPGVRCFWSPEFKGNRGDFRICLSYAPVNRSALLEGGRWSVAVANVESNLTSAMMAAYRNHFTAAGLLMAGMFLFGMLAHHYERRLTRALQSRVRSAEADLREKEQIYREIVERSTDLIFILTPDGRVQLLNNQAQFAFRELSTVNQSNGNGDADRDTLVGRRLSDILSPVDWSYLERKTKRAIAGKGALSFDHSVHFHERKVRFSTTLIPVYGANGAAVSVIGVTRDISERAEMDQRLYQAEKLASIGTLAAGVAHEINNPLAIILGFTELLLEKVPPDSPLFADLKIIEDNGHIARNVIDDLLGFARTSEGGLGFVDAEQAVQRVIKMTKYVSGGAKAAVEIRVDEPLGLVRCDPREFQQVIMNLLNNALAAINSESGRVIIGLSRRDDWGVITVQDNGAGIPERIQPFVFDPFFTTKVEGKGTGLGLWLCYNIITKWGGRISFTSVCKDDYPSEESGTTFTIHLPIIQPEKVQ